MRREDLYLNDIVEAADHISTFIAGVDFEAFEKSEMMRSAVVQKLAIIGEAAARLPESLKKLHSIVKGVKVHKMFVDGEDVCQLYDMETNSPAGTAFISEWLTVHKGKIASIRVVFDARPFAAMFAK